MTSTDAERAVTVAVDGSAAVLAGMASARPSTEERFAEPTWRTFDGRVLAVVRPVEPGSATVTVSAQGLEDVRIALEVVGA